MIRSLWDGMVKEARLVPYTVALVSFLSLVVAAFVWPGVITPPASKASIVDLVHRFDRFELSISVDATKNRILLMDAEIYQLEREVARARATGNELPDVVEQRLHRLRSERSVADRELSALLGRREPADDFP